MKRRQETVRSGGVEEAEDMSYFDIPTVPFWLMNFHFRGQSMSVTATLVLWPKTAYCRLWWYDRNISFCIMACWKVNLLRLCEWIWSLFCNSLHYFNFGVHMRLESAHTQTQPCGILIDSFSGLQRHEHFSLTDAHTHTDKHLFACTTDQRSKHTHFLLQVLLKGELHQ